MFPLLSFYAFFTILCHIAVFSEWSFKTVAQASFIPVICTILLHFFFKSRNLNIEIADHISEINRNKLDNIFIFTIIILSLTICIFSVRHSTDEAFYASVEVHSIEHPELPLLKYDGMFGEPDIPILHPSYKVQSYQILSAVISYWTGITPPLVRHVFFPLIATLLFLVVWIKLLQLFTPKNWQLGLFTLIVLLSLTGGHHSLTNFSIIRFFDGKCLLAYIIMPSLYYSSVLFFRKQTCISWYNLTIIQIAGVGLSSSAIFLLPLQTFIIGLAYWKPNYNETRNCILFGMSSLYVVIIGIAIKIMMDTINIDGTAVLSSKASAEFYLQEIIPNLLDVLGQTIPVQILSIIAIASAWMFLPKGGDLKRLSYVIPLIMVFVVLNPLLMSFFTSLTSKFAYWRLLYIIPVPLFIIVMIIGIINRGQVYLAKKWDIVFIVALIFIFLASPYLYSRHPFRSPHNSWNMDYYFSPRFEPKTYEIAKIIRANTTPKTLALAPKDISQWLAAMPSSPKLVAVNASGRNEHSYISIMHHYFDAEEVDIRKKMHQIISGKVDDFDAELFSSGLKQMRVGSVTFSSKLPYRNKLIKLLSNMGYKNIGFYEEYTLWVLNPKEPRTPTTSSNP